MSDVTISKAVRTNLLSLQNTAQMMEKTQERLATGKKVNSALDNPSSFFTASSLNSRASDLNNLLDSMNSGIKVIEAANNGLTALTKNLESMQSSLRQARQDKSFQTQSYDVTNDSVLKINGGQIGGEKEIKLQTAAEGVKASVQSKSPYTAAIPGAKEGVGARAVVTLDSAHAGDKLSIDGIEITLGNTTDAESLSDNVKEKLQEALGGITEADLEKKYKISAEKNADDEYVVTIENADPYKAAPQIKFGAGVTEATKGTTTFKYDPAAVGSITVGSQTVENTGSFDDFVNGLKAKAADGKYTVTADTDTKQITLTNTEYGATRPEVSGIPAHTTHSTASFKVDAASVDGAKFTLDGVELSLSGEQTDKGDTATAMKAAIEADTELAARYKVEISGADNNEIKITARTAGAAAAPKLTVGDLNLKDIKTQAGDTGYKFTNGAAGAKVETVKAASDELTVNYGNSSAKIELHSTRVATPATITFKPTALTATATMKLDGIDVKVGAAAITDLDDMVSAYNTAISGNDTLKDRYSAAKDTDGNIVITAKDGVAHKPTVELTGATDATAVVAGGMSETETTKYRADAAANINAQLKAQGLDDVEASFDSTGRLSFSAKTGEEKLLSVSGAQAHDLFKGDSTSVGKAEVSGYTATTAVDKFVEEINRSYEGKLRASNDNGKLRIENLSTQQLDVSFDKDGAGAGAPTSSKIGGNAVRTNMAAQFNELRDQFDKLADDASFNGINLLRGDKLSITFNETGSSSLAIQSKDKNDNARAITASKLDLDSLISSDLDSDEAIDAFLSKVSGALSEIRTLSSTLGTNLSVVQNRKDFTTSMITTLQAGASNLTLADTNEEAANLLALQTRQSLSTSAMSMASQSDQNVLQLLR